MWHSLVLSSIVLSYAGGHGDADRPDVHAHDGFYLNMALGLGYTTIALPGNDTLSANNIHGMGVDFHLDIGAAIVENVIIFARLTSDAMPSPQVGGGSLTDTSVATSGLGGGLGFYVMPANIFLKASAVGESIHIRYRSGNVTINDDSDLGVVLHGEIGKEWWVSDNWGMGIAAQGFYGWVNEFGESRHPAGINGALTATFN